MPLLAKRRRPDPELFTVAVRNSMVEIKLAVGEPAPQDAQGWSRARCLSQLLQGTLAAGARTVVVDLEGSGEADTLVLAVLIEARGRARRCGAVLVMRGSPALQQLAEICRLESVLSLA